MSSKFTMSCLWRIFFILRTQNIHISATKNIIIPRSSISLDTSYNVNAIEMCKVIPELDGNVSDHLPLHMLFTLDVNSPIKQLRSSRMKLLHAHLWGDKECKNRYRDILQRKLENLTLIKIDKEADLKIIKQKLLDSHDKNISNAMHQAAKEAGCYPEKRFKLKAFWCPELQKLKRQNAILVATMILWSAQK